MSDALVGLRSSDKKSMSRLRDSAEYVSKVKHRWAGHHEKDRRQMDTKNSGMDSSLSNHRGRPPTDDRLTCSLPAEFSAVTSNGSRPREHRRRSSIPTS
ncbi:unnamed protein product [Strongylus vulgaris]|uniref:Uncharacterized protein n=1 Tax=Strongylus vulgaris TaxID=40348 RepID=A0A3P7IR02_STRVU|nr:unnamed protein product [Strongylus vulgaris]